MSKSVYDNLIKHPPIIKMLENYNDEFDNNIVFQWVQDRLRYPLRPYQKKASLILDTILQNPIFSNEALEEIKDRVKIPRLTFEMATGAGKTLQMLAHLLQLNAIYSYRHFLIITPNNIIYDKTIENFTPNHFESEWSNNLDLKVNIVTSDNYKDKTCWTYEDPDLSVYIFNVQKFYNKPSIKKSKGDGADISSGIPWVYRALEDSVWRDSDDNCISFIEHLKLQEGLVVFSDEAHHYQKNTSKRVINDLEPNLLLEYTATPQKDLQNVVYKYGIKDLIEEKYSKRIRTLSFGKYVGNIETKSELLKEDKKRIMLGLIVHQIKKESVISSEKSLCLIKAREIEHARRIEGFLQDIHYEKALYLEVLNDIKYSNSSMSKLILDQIQVTPENQWKNIIKSCAALPLRYDSQTNSNKEIRKELMRLETPGTLTEIIIAVDALDEGWNVKRLYTIVVLHEGEKAIATSVKQLIGRGIRLYRPKRVKDTSPIKDQQDELLHIICVAGRSFDKAIASIALELGLSSNDLGDEEEFVDIEQCINEDWITQPLPMVIKSIVSKFTRTVKGFKTDEEAYIFLINRFIKEELDDLELQKWLSNKVAIIDGRNVLALLPSGQLTETELYTIDLMVNEQRDLIEELKHVKLNTPSIQLIRKDVYEKISFIGQFNETHNLMNEAILKIFVNLYRIEAVDEVDAYKFLLNDLMKWLETRLKSFWYDIEISHEGKQLGELFPNNISTVNKNKIVNNYIEWQEHRTKGKIKENIRNYHFSLNLNSMIYGSYFNADSLFEIEMAITLDKWINGKGSGWIKNNRQYSIPYNDGNDKWFNYYPDFIIFYNNMIYLLETKGDIYIEDAIPKKNAAENLYKYGYPIKYLFFLYTNKDLLTLESFEEFLNSLEELN